MTWPDYEQMVQLGQHLRRVKVMVEDAITRVDQVLKGDNDI